MRKLSLKEGKELAHSYTANKGQSWGLFALKIRSLYTTAWEGGAGETSFGLWGFIAPGKGRNEEMIQRNGCKSPAPSVSAPCLRSLCLRQRY